MLCETQGWGEAALPPWECNCSSTKLFLERLRVIRAGHGSCLWEKAQDQNRRLLTSQVCLLNFKHMMKRLEPLLKPEGAFGIPPLPGYQLTITVGDFFLFLLVSTLYLCLFWFSGATEKASLKSY